MHLLPLDPLLLKLGDTLPYYLPVFVCYDLNNLDRRHHPVIGYVATFYCYICI